MNVYGRHRPFRRGNYSELRLRSDVARRVDSRDARLLRFIYPQQTAFRIQAASECFMEVGRELGAEIEEQRVAFERFAFRK